MRLAGERASNFSSSNGNDTGWLMGKTLTALIFVVLSRFAMAAPGAMLPATGMWEKKEMNPRVNESVGVFQIKDVSLLPAGTPNPGDPNCTTAVPCAFDLSYTIGAQFGLNKGGFNILFIPGGPGIIINEADGPGGCKAGEIPPNDCSGDPPSGNEVLNKLAFGDDFNGRHNLVYFHVRGTGQSMIDRRNNNDKFLRAKYVVDDIERLRKELLQDKPWDAIYAHSWGTVVAQLYAAREFDNDSVPKVKSLILSAPIARRDPTTINARVKQTVSNLEDIYRFFRPPGACAISGTSYLKSRVADFEAHLTPDLERTDNLCFITDSQVVEITSKVAKIIQAVEEDYGSLSFVQDHYDEIKAQLAPELKLPQEFFAALRKLQFLGAPYNKMKRNHEGLLFTADALKMVDVALTLGFHLTQGVDRSLTSCDPAGKFFVGAAARVKKDYCKRLRDAKANFLMLSMSQSVRASTVFGVYDGVARWVPRMLNKEDCFSGIDLSRFANGATGNSDKKRFLRAFAKRIGSASKDEPPVCGWDPGGGNAHSVPTLILAGDTDAIIAGCQAEEFYNRGLKGQKVFLQFPGQGHDMSITDQRDVNPRQTRAMADLIDKFIRAAGSPQSEFEKFIGSAKSELELVKAVATSNSGIPCP